MKRLLLICSMLFAGFSAAATAPISPNLSLTPGDYDSSVTLARVCASTFPRQSFPTVFVQSIVTQQMAAYSVTNPTCASDPKGYVPDLSIPAFFGGKNTTKNTWVMNTSDPYWTPNLKRVTEDGLLYLVCHNGTGITPLPLATARTAIAASWPIAYRTYINTSAPSPLPTITGLPTATPTDTPTNTPTKTPTPTNTPTRTPTPTRTNTPTRTPTPTNTSTPTNTPTATNTPTSTPTHTPTP